MLKQPKPIVADLILLLVTAIWGSTFVIVKEAITDYPPMTFLALRFSLATLSLALFGGVKSWLRPQVVLAGCIAGLFLSGGYIFQTVGLLTTTPSKAGFITGLSVVLVPLLLAIWLKQPPPRQVCLGALAAAAGLALLTLGPGLRLTSGDLWVLACAFCFALQIIVVGRYAGEIDPLSLTGVQLAVVTLVTAFLAIFESQPSTLPTATWVGLLLTAIPATSLAFFLQTNMQRFTTASHTALVFSAEPVFAALFAFLLVGELLGPTGLLGSVLILAGILAAELAPRKPYPAKNQEAT